MNAVFPWDLETCGFSIIVYLKSALIHRVEQENTCKVLAKDLAEAWGWGFGTWLGDCDSDPQLVYTWKVTLHIAWQISRVDYICPCLESFMALL